MNIIKLQVKNFEIIPLEKQYVVENQVNEFAIEFEFDDSWNYETKYVIFDNEETTYKRPIINNQVIIPSELLNGRTTIQIYGQNVEDGEIVKRKPSYKYSFSILNSLSTEGQEESDLPTPSQWEVYIQQIQNLCNDLQDQFNDLKEECETKCDDVIERLGEAEQDIQTNTDNIRTNAENIDKLNTDLLDYSLITETGNKISMSINPQTYVITLSLKDKNDNILSTQSVDLPLETMIVSASYSNGILTFTLKNGQTLQVPISDLIDGLVSTDTFNQAIQGLSNRITSIENDYLKASDKTELQNQITANADDISDIKGEQLTQNADIESLQQENERLSRIVSGLPTKNASGTNFVLNDMVNCEIKEISLKGDTYQDGTPTPSSPVEIQSVKGNQTIQFCGKNLFNRNNCLRGYSANYGTVGKTPDVSQQNVRITLTPNNAIKAKPNTTYTFKFGKTGFYFALAELKEGKITNGDSGWKSGTLTITTKADTQYIAFNFGYNGGSGWEIITDNIWNEFLSSEAQLEEGSTATDYEQYSGTTFPISLGTIELNKIGDYQDKIYKQNDKWYLRKEIMKRIFDGSETYTIGNALENTTDFRINNSIGAIATGYDSTNFYTDRFIRQAGATSDIECSWLNGYGYIRFRVNSTIASTIEGFKKWAKNNNITAYYIMATPTDTEITDATLISQLEALNNYILLTNNTIISSGNLPVINDITGYVDIMSLISTQDNRNIVEEKKVVTKPIEEPIETKEDER